MTAIDAQFFGRKPGPVARLFALRITKVGGYEWHAQQCLHVLEDEVDFEGAPPDRFACGETTLAISAVRLNAGQADGFAQDWNAADGSEQARCHYPRHGFATWSGTRFDWVCGICFECYNASFAGDLATTDRRRMLDLDHQGQTPLDRLKVRFDQVFGPD